jgi:hypothetical protein
MHSHNFVLIIFKKLKSNWTLSQKNHLCDTWDMDRKGDLINLKIMVYVKTL